MLREAIPEAAALPPALGLLVAVLRKQLGVSRALTLRHLSDPSLSDDAIADALEAGNIGEDEAYNRILLRAASEAVSYFLEFPKNGERPLLEEAMRILDDAVLIARENRFVDWWWWLFCLRFLFQEFGEASPWTQLPPFRDAGESSVLVDEYIRSGLRQDPPVMELWPSQAKAVPMIADASRPAFCLKMPTSSGKTRVAELTILRFLLDHPLDPDAKCIYLAPFRSLAVEVEQSLRRSFGTLGVVVSQIYGGFEITPADLVSLDQYRILIATPEKFDALLRCVPDLTQKIRLAIVDEGHIVDLTDRGLRFDFFVHRLRRLLPHPRCRFVFISAVLPNARDFAEWITGSAEGLVESSWRPSRLMLGRLSWDAGEDRLHPRGERAFRTGVLRPRFIEQKPCRGISGAGRRQNPFPHDAQEAFALSALLFAREGATLVFVPQQRSVMPFADVLLRVLLLQRALKRDEGESFSLPAPGRGSLAWARCRSVIEGEMGADSPLLTLLEEGIVVHHGDLPWRVRIAVEELARGDALRLLVATTTLAQGVNLPIKTVLVRGLSHGHNETVSPTTFWNICGRAGRAMRESEGQILFCVDRTVPQGQLLRQEEAIRTAVDALEQATVTSGLLRLLSAIAGSWEDAHPDVDLGELCVHLADNRYDCGTPEQQEDLRSWIDRLDGHLLSLSEEFGIAPEDLDRLQEVLEGSLLFIQLRQLTAGPLTTDTSRDLLQARIRHIHRSQPDGQVRRRMYRLGMCLSSCEVIEERHPDLLSLYRETEGWTRWSGAEHAGLLLRLSQFIFGLRDTRPVKPIPEQWPAILAAWLGGRSTSDMARDEAIARFSSSPSELSLLIEELCGYRMPWGLNSIFNYLSDVAAAEGAPLPPVCAYFSGMVKYGLDDPIAVCLVAYLDQDRQLALRAASACPHGLDHPDRAIRWLLHVPRADLEAAGLSQEVAEGILRKRDQHRREDGRRVRERPSDRLALPVSGAEVARLRAGQKVIVVPQDESEGSVFEVMTLSGSSLGECEHPQGVIPDWWRTVHLVDAEVVTVREGEDGRDVVIQLVGV